LFGNFAHQLEAFGEFISPLICHNKPGYKGKSCVGESKRIGESRLE